MNELAWFATGFGTGAITAGGLVFRASLRVLSRRDRLMSEEAATVERERLRAARDSGRTEQVRPEAGEAAKLGNLFQIRPKKRAR